MQLVAICLWRNAVGELARQWIRAIWTRWTGPNDVTISQSNHEVCITFEVRRLDNFEVSYGGLATSKAMEVLSSAIRREVDDQDVVEEVSPGVYSVVLERGDRGAALSLLERIQVRFERLMSEHDLPFEVEWMAPQSGPEPNDGMVTVQIPEIGAIYLN